jgi:hypothetical protein
VLIRALSALLLAVIAAAGVTSAAAAGTAPPDRSGSCGAPLDCGDHHVQPTSDSTPTACLRDAGCGGGVLAFAGALAVALVPRTARIAAAPRVRARLRQVTTSLDSRLTASRLFRPPRLSS